MTMWIKGAVGAAFVLAVHAALGGPTVTTRTLLAELTDLNHLSEYPQPPFTCRQSSSYDRRSTTPDDPNTWFANNDAGQYIRIEEHELRGEAGALVPSGPSWVRLMFPPCRGEFVIMDADGPGAIVRIWSANPAGTLRIYLDDAETPALEVPMVDLLGGKVDGVPPPLAMETSRGWNCYLPIAYGKHCKVTGDRIVSADGRQRVYYHVNYRTYPANTSVTTFTAGDLNTLADDVRRVAGRLVSPRGVGLDPPWNDELDGEPADPNVDPAALDQPGFVIRPGRVSPWQMKAARPSAITGMRVKVYGDQREQVLRRLLLTMTFDGEPTVECPLGDFFGAGPGLHPYAGLPTGIAEDGELWSHWVMPFRESARVEIKNMSGQPVRMRLGIGTSEHEWTDGSLHFHAQWRTEFDVPTRPMQDWNYVHVKGQGVFVGAAFAIANPVKHWWGEGDEKIYCDGESFPSHFGTGTEDYYGYAWCWNVPFTHAYHAQPQCDGPGNYGQTAVNRWHIIDRIPFGTELRFDMELWHWKEDCVVPGMSIITYWYGRPGTWSNVRTVQRDDLRYVELPPYVPPRVAGVLEGEELRVIDLTGHATPQDIDACSNEKHLWWRDGHPAEQLVLGFPVAAAGRYQVAIRCVRANDYGITQVSINDQKASGPLDLYHANVTVSDELPLGEFNLTAGENRLTAQIISANEKAKPSYMFGLDYIRLELLP